MLLWTLSSKIHTRVTWGKERFGTHGVMDVENVLHVNYEKEVLQDICQRFSL